MILRYVPRWPRAGGEWMEVLFQSGQHDGVIIRCPVCNHSIRVYHPSEETLGIHSPMVISPAKALSIEQVIKCPYMNGRMPCSWHVKITESNVEEIDDGDPRV